MELEPTQRVEAEYTSHSARFCVKRPIFSEQYFHVYAQRSRLLRKPLEIAAQQKWPCDLEAREPQGEQMDATTMQNNDEGDTKVPILRKVLDAKEGQLCVLIGTVYKEMPKKPCVLDDVSKDLTIQPSKIVERYTDDLDTLVLEDSSGRVLLKGVIDPSTSTLCTGIGLAVLGRACPGGQFVVEDWTLAGLAPQASLPTRTNDAFVAIVSGLAFGDPAAQMLPSQLAADWLMGLSGSPSDIALSSKVVRVIVAGNSLCDASKVLKDDSLKVWTRKRVSALETAQVHHAMESLDCWVAAVASCVPVDVMSGPWDPTNKALPQQPLHPSMFPRASKLAKFCCVPNPYDFEVDGVRILGTAGQPTQDVLASVNCDDPLSILAQDIQSQHIAPTAPDTITCFPFPNTDPFVVEQTPHIYFAGNQANFGVRTVATKPASTDGTDETTNSAPKATVLCVPEFHKTQQLVLVNLSTGKCSTLCFQPTPFLFA